MPDSDEFIRILLGIGGSIFDRIYNNFGKHLEARLQEIAKSTFKKIGLGHWVKTVQAGIVLLVFLLPVCFIFTVCLGLVIITCYNTVSKFMFGRKVKNLTDRRDLLVKQLNDIKGKKSN